MKAQIDNLFNIKKIIIDTDIFEYPNLLLVTGENFSGKSLLLKYLFILYYKGKDKDVMFKHIFNEDYDEFKRKFGHKYYFEPEKREKYQPVFIEPEFLVLLKYNIDKFLKEKFNYQIYKPEILKRFFGFTLKNSKNEEKNWKIVLPDEKEIPFNLSSQSLLYISLMHNYIWSSNFNVIIIDNIDLFLSYNFIESMAYYIKYLIDLDLTVICSFNNSLFIRKLIEAFNTYDVEKNILVSFYDKNLDGFRFKHI